MRQVQSIVRDSQNIFLSYFVGVLKNVQTFVSKYMQYIGKINAKLSIPAYVRKMTPTNTTPATATTAKTKMFLKSVQDILLLK